ncbi:hypothetical protein LAZ40_05695 [Cereibacter sphaeroides]|uniref:hypothetical protein n=1 Tax=Cereibacter sphaeroides TaxID=1063 RepID=UPI001F1FE06B|nr:hypothetical protein [Cereibacter sphaeroides]MCE6958543.1 hypothetical protein [Cereibacter sphaeroides]MCE6972794.1 hypothetical protein [Cereibacter sphaeroides]
MPRDNAAAIAWMVNRLAEKARNAKRRITNRWQWRKLDHDGLEVAMARGIDAAVVACFPLGFGAPPPCLPIVAEPPKPIHLPWKATARYPTDRETLKAVLVDIVRSLRTRSGAPVTTLAEWRVLHEGSYARALAKGLQREVCEELGWL